MIAKLKTFKRAAFGAAALALLAVVAIPVLSNTVLAAQVTDRSIEMSDSTPSATNVTYKATFTPTSATPIAGMVIDFCSNDPIVGDTCTAPTGFSVGSVAGAGNTTVSGGSGGTWTAASANTGRTLELTSTGASGAPSAVTVTLTTVTNPSAPAGTFYARILTFANSSDVAAWEADDCATKCTAGDGASSLNVVDYGGVALSTVEQIQITAKVMESLSMCTSKIDISGGNYGGDSGDKSCLAAVTPDITIGHGTPTATIDASTVDYAPAYIQMSTNASQGASVRMKSTNASCAGLSSDGGATCDIPSINSATPKQMNPGTAGFGLFVAASQLTAGATSSGTIDPAGPYDGDGHITVPSDVYLGMDETANTGVSSTYGSKIASCSGPISQVNSKLVFGATASLTTPAGIYTNNEILIATGTF